jgi:hypothetical protein
LNTTYYDASAQLAAFIFLFVFWLIFAVGFYVLSAWFLMKIFDKAGVQGRWRAWIPIYNFMIFLKLGDLSPWLILVGIGAVIPFIGFLFSLAAFVITLLAAWRVGQKLQKEAVWLILYFFLSIVWLGINAFDKSRWNTAIPAAPWANNFLADKTTWNGIPSQVPAGGYPSNPVTEQPGYPAPGAYPPPAGYQQPPAGYQPPAAPPAGYQPPAAPPAAAPPAAAPETPVTPPPAADAPPAATPPADAASPAADAARDAASEAPDIDFGEDKPKA